MNAGNVDKPASRSPRPCPICGKPAMARYRPFCSKRCADVDLGRWFGETYRIPAEEEDEEPQPQGGRDEGEEG
jgi:uncharacterized protein